MDYFIFNAGKWLILMSVIVYWGIDFALHFANEVKVSGDLAALFLWEYRFMYSTLNPNYTLPRR